jgi:hypothetical protein
VYLGGTFSRLDEDKVDSLLLKMADRFKKELEGYDVDPYRSNAQRQLIDAYCSMTASIEDFVWKLSKSEGDEFGLTSKVAKSGVWFHAGFGLCEVGSKSTSSMKGLAFWDYDHFTQDYANLSASRGTGTRIEGVEPLRFGGDALDSDMFSFKPVKQLRQ